MKTVNLYGNELYAKFSCEPKEEMRLRDKLRSLPGGALWKARERAWVVPDTMIAEEFFLTDKPAWKFIGDAYAVILKPREIPITRIPDPSTIDLSPFDIHADLREFQVHALKGIKAREDWALLSFPPGSGKALWDMERVVTPRGWSLVKDIRPGDELLSPITGAPVVVSSIHPQPIQQLYTVTFLDGRSAVCTNDHLWAVRDKYSDKPILVKELSYIREKGLRCADGTWRFAVKYPTPVSWADENAVPLDPWLFGYLLGNGIFPKRVNLQPRVVTPDQWTVDTILSIIRRELGSSYFLRQTDPYSYNICSGHTGPTQKGVYRNKLSLIFNELGLLGCLSYTKFIPDVYLNASVSDRFSLIQGLLDSDGTSRPKSSSLLYTTTSERMAYQIQMIVRSLGGYSSVNPKVKSYTYLGEKRKGRTSYDVSMSFPPSLGCPFRIPRKAERFIPRRSNHLSIVSIALHSIGPSTCFTVADEHHLYMAGDFIPTHNTAIGANWLKTLKLSKPALIVVPSFLKLQWEREMVRWAGEDVQILKGQTPTKLLDRHYVINYEILPYWVNTLNGHFDVIIADESHNLADLNNKRTDAFFWLHKKAKHLLLMTGTPLLSRLDQLYPTAKMLAPKVFDSITWYRNRYCDPKKDMMGNWVYKGATHVDELHDLLRPYMIRETKTSLMPWLPKKNRFMVHVPVPKDLESRYVALRKEFEHDREGLKAQMAMAELSCTAYFEKQSFVHQFIDDMLEEGIEKMIVGAFHTRVIDDLAKKFKGFLVIDGRVPTDKRQPIVDAFQNDSKVQGIILQMNSAVGFTLDKSHDMVVVEPVWSPLVLEQAEDRQHRINTDPNAQINYYYIVADGTVEEKMFEIVDRKNQNFSGVLDGASKSYFEDVKHIYLNK